MKKNMVLRLLILLSMYLAMDLMMGSKWIFEEIEETAQIAKLKSEGLSDKHIDYVISLRREMKKAMRDTESAKAVPVFQKKEIDVR